MLNSALECQDTSPSVVLPAAIPSSSCLLAVWEMHLSEQQDLELHELLMHTLGCSPAMFGPCDVQEQLH